MYRQVSICIISTVLVFFLLTGCSNQEVSDKSINRRIRLQDMAGRDVIIPEKVEKVFSTGPVGTILLYTLNPNKMIGWNYRLSEGEKRFISEKFHALPNLGGAGKEEINIEEILKIDPDIIIMMDTLDEAIISKIEILEESTAKPIVFLDEDIHKIDIAYQILGQIIHEEDRARQLANHCRETLETAQEHSLNIPQEKKIKIYYAEGPYGLETEPAGSWHGEVIDIVGGYNVAKVEVGGIKGKTKISIEQLLSWDPELIIAWDDERGGYYSQIFKDSIWKDINAVKNHRVYAIPNRPFNWFDRPPSVNRILGIKWLGSLLYPDVFNYDIEKEVREFYSKFYHYDLSNEEIEELLKDSRE